MGLVVAELVLRGIGYWRPTFYRFDPDRGWALRPNAEGIWDSEGYSDFTTNSEGLHDREHNVRKPRNTLRIAVLGDSMTEARQVPLEKNFCSILQRRLDGCAVLKGRHPEVINFAAPGYSTAQELLTLRDQVWKYRPDIVVLAFYSDNDVDVNSPKASPSTYNVTTLQPLFRLDHGNLVRDNWRLDNVSWRTHLVLFLSVHSRLFQLVNENTRRRFDGIYRVLKYQLGHRLETKARSPETNAGMPPLPLVREKAPPGELQCVSPPFMDGAIYLPPASQHQLEAWAITEALLRQLHKEITQKGVKFLLVSLSNPPQDFPDPQYRKEYMRRCGITDLFYPEQRIDALAESEGIEVLNLAQPLQAYAQQNHVFLHGFGNSAVSGVGHLNEIGHRLIGEKIADRVCETIAEH